MSQGAMPEGTRRRHAPHWSQYPGPLCRPRERYPEGRYLLLALQHNRRGLASCRVGIGRHVCIGPAIQQNLRSALDIVDPAPGSEPFAYPRQFRLDCHGRLNAAGRRGCRHNPVERGRPRTAEALYPARSPPAFVKTGRRDCKTGTNSPAFTVISVGDSLTVELRTLTPLVLVRIQVPQPIRKDK